MTQRRKDDLFKRLKKQQEERFARLKKEAEKNFFFAPPVMTKSNGGQIKLVGRKQE